jgi:hypothetical protein
MGAVSWVKRRGGMNGDEQPRREQPLRDETVTGHWQRAEAHVELMVRQPALKVAPAVNLDQERNLRLLPCKCRERLSCDGDREPRHDDDPQTPAPISAAASGRCSIPASTRLASR